MIIVSMIQIFISYRSSIYISKIYNFLYGPYELSININRDEHIKEKISKWGLCFIIPLFEETIYTFPYSLYYDKTIARNFTFCIHICIIILSCSQNKFITGINLFNLINKMTLDSSYLNIFSMGLSSIAFGAIHANFSCKYSKLCAFIFTIKQIITYLLMISISYITPQDAWLYSFINHIMNNSFFYYFS